MTAFGITTPGEMLAKLIEEQRDFIDGHCLSARHAINAVMTAYHLHEWVWGGFVKQRHDLHKVWQLSLGRKAEKRDFLRWLMKKQQCPALMEAEKVTDGTKHFNISNISTGSHRGAFQTNAFQHNAFDVSYLWIERNGQRQRALYFIEELVDFWSAFFAKYDVALKPRPRTSIGHTELGTRIGFWLRP